MQTFLDIKLASQYKNQTQKARILTENWVREEVFCPQCGENLQNYPNNKPVGDFFCSQCSEDFELKSSKSPFGGKVVDGAYNTMIGRLNSTTNPNFFFLSYDVEMNVVKHFFIVPKQFFIPSMIEKRKPLSAKARRAGWVGCNLLLQDIPLSGKIFYIKDQVIQNKDTIIQKWNSTLFLRKTNKAELKGWLLDTMKYIDMLEKNEYSMKQKYSI